MFKKNKDAVDIPEAARSNSVQKKEQSIIRTFEQPVLPRLTKIVFWVMIILTAAMVLVDINAYARYDFYLGLKHLFLNIFVTGFSIIVVLLCWLGIRQNRRHFWKRKEENGVVEQDEQSLARDRRALRKLNQVYFFYIKICCGGVGAWGILYIAALILR